MSAALEDTANLEETENDVMMRKEVKEVFPSVLRLARSFNAGVMIAVRVPAQLLVTLITLVIIPSIHNVQVVCTLFCFLGNRESIFRDVENIVTDHRVNAARREEPDGVRSADDGTPQGLKAPYTYVESETDLFRERFTFFFPKTPTTLNHKNRTFYASKTVKTAECAEALKHLHARMAKPNQTETNHRRHEGRNGHHPERARCCVRSKTTLPLTNDYTTFPRFRLLLSRALKI